MDETLPVIKPFQKFKVIWDLLILFIIGGFFFLIPMQLCFDFDYEQELQTMIAGVSGIPDSTAKFFVLAPELCLIIDTLLKFITGFYENGLVITDKHHIVVHYLKHGAIFDLLSYCPIFAQSVQHGATLSLKILQFLVFCKMKRVQIIINNFKEMISLSGKNDYILSLITLTIQIIFFCHINACIWHMIAYYYPSHQNSITWLDSSHTKSLPWASRYYYSLYWAVSVMVTIGFGEKVSPQNELELGFGVLIYLSSALFFGYTINAMREIFDEMSKHAKQYKFYLFHYIFH